jgi:hypothetical protein
MQLSHPSSLTPYLASRIPTMFDIVQTARGWTSYIDHRNRGMKVAGVDGRKAQRSLN